MSTPKKTKAPGRAAKEETTPDVIFLRNVPELVVGLDAWLVKLNAATRGPKWTRTALARAAIDRAIKEWGTTGEAP